MKITDVETIILRLPVVELIGDGTQDVAIVKIHTDEGIVGIGEGHTSPYVIESIINAPASHVASRGLKELLIGQNPLDIGVLWRRMFASSSVYGRRGAVIHAISAIDLALWDILGKATGLSVSQLLGGTEIQEVDAYASILMPPSPHEAQRQAEALAEQGFRAIKFGWGHLGAGVAKDLAYVKAIREAVGCDIAIMIDIGTGVSLDYATRLARALEDHDIYFLEEPLPPDDLAAYARLTSATQVPIATGEKETTLSGFEQLITRGRVDIIQPDLARAGGLTELRRIAVLAQLHGVRLVPHCWSTDILVAATVQFVATLPDHPYVEFCVNDSPLRREVAREPITASNGRIRIPTGPGLGVALNEETVARYRYH